MCTVYIHIFGGVWTKGVKFIHDDEDDNEPAFALVVYAALSLSSAFVS